MKPSSTRNLKKDRKALCWRYAALRNADVNKGPRKTVDHFKVDVFDVDVFVLEVVEKFPHIAQVGLSRVFRKTLLKKDVSAVFINHFQLSSIREL